LQKLQIVDGLSYFAKLHIELLRRENYKRDKTAVCFSQITVDKILIVLTNTVQKICIFDFRKSVFCAYFTSLLL